MNDKNKSLSAVNTFVYGVRGLTEWHAVIKAGRASIRIPFTGGTLTGYGCTPAIFSTRSEALAKIIESSDLYKSQRIIRLR